MSLSLDEYRTKLINIILLAGSQEEVSNFIQKANITLAKSKAIGQLKASFYEEIIKDLSSFSPMEKNAQQWSNIKVAIILFNRLKNMTITVANKIS